MNKDIKKIEIKLKSYIKLIYENYKDYLNQELIDYLIKNESNVRFNEENTVSFICRNNMLYLPKIAYYIFLLFEKDKKYGINPNNIVMEEDYLNTNTTYFDYINHVIESGLTVYDYFEENLLHETMHLCGSGGSNPFKEGINELKTRELAKKHHIKIAAMAYPKEVELVKKFQYIVGKELLDELTFNNEDLSIASSLLEKKGSKKIATLYKNLIITSEEESKEILNLATRTDNPYEKAHFYSKINYSKSNKLLDEFLKGV